MPVIQVHDEQHTLQRGQTRLGAGPDADVRVGDDASGGVQAVVELGADDRAVIRRAGAASAVKVNGVLLGAEPTPLMHGDKVEIGGVEAQISDDTKAGTTQYVSASEIAAMAAKRGGAARATTATGGRLVSLVDGKEYTISDAGARIGRDASNEIVVAQSAVSRHHARVAPGDGGYVLTDQSTNGVLVNGDRVQGTRLLARADVIRVGTEEFRFYADVAPVGLAAAPPPARPAPPPLSQEPPTLPPLELVLEPAQFEAASPPPPAPAAAPPAPHAPLIVAPEPVAVVPEAERPVLAELEIVKEGPDKGRRIPIHEALAHIGRGSHNDVSFADDSVSDMHARLQLRDDGWYIVDAGSTNGTFVGGVRISGERRLDGTPDLRFGGVRVRFHPLVQPAMAPEGTRRVSVGSFGAEFTPDKSAAAVPRWVWIAGGLAVVLLVLLVLLKR
jgi:pSer/pThr/pTyr-binding forkhead associated (FHA) protein